MRSNWFCQHACGRPLSLCLHRVISFIQGRTANPAVTVFKKKVVVSCGETGYLRNLDALAIQENRAIFRG